MSKLSVRGVVSRRRSGMGSQDLFQLSGDSSSFWQDSRRAQHVGGPYSVKAHRNAAARDFVSFCRMTLAASH